MSQDTAVLCSDLPVLREVAGDAARYVPALDVGAWADALDELLGDRQARQRLQDAGRLRLPTFTWERTVRETHAVYAEALGR
jgi:glycosyltransferase involved in cell wall biosynthesis